jgi:beta-glucosidase
MYSDFVDKLCNNMSLDEKIAQMVQISPVLIDSNADVDVTGPLKDRKISDNIARNKGSYLGQVGAKNNIQRQKQHLKVSKNKIPLIFMMDVVHGYKTIFPIPLALACSWNENDAEEMARISAKEAAVSGVHVTFSPAADLSRDPRWGRVMESFGEDPYLSSNYAVAMVKGYQGDGIENKYSIASCVKHFAAYGAAEGGRDYNTVDMSEVLFREFYLPSYSAAIKAGWTMVMPAFNTLNGIPCTSNNWLLKNVLRDELHFDGITISDFNGIDELVHHGSAKDSKDAAKKAIVAGVDIDMMSKAYSYNLRKLVDDGAIDEVVIDDIVKRILSLKEKLGLFKNPIKDADEKLENEIHLCPAHRNIARRISASSMVLLKNEGILPLDKDRGNIAIVGPFSNSKSILGGWCGDGKEEEVISLYEGICSKIDKDRVIAIDGCGMFFDDKEISIELIDDIKDNVDYFILALGEHQLETGEGASKGMLELSIAQQRLARYVFSLGKPVITILFNGRPLDIREISNHSDALLEAWFPGTEGGNAIAHILFGDVNPSGKLCMSIPYCVGQIPVYYNHYNTGRPKRYEENNYRYISKYLDIPNAPLYPFGYGISYTKYEYRDMKLSSDILYKDDTIKCSITVTNIGDRKGEEIVQLYIKCIGAPRVSPVKQLKGYRKMAIMEKESVTITFDINIDMLIPEFEDKSLYDGCEFVVMIGKDSQNTINKSFIYNAS